MTLTCLYVGPGMLFPGTKLGPSLRDDVAYISIDRDPDHEYFYNRSNKIGDRSKYVFSDFLSSTLIDGISIFSEIHMYNILSDHRVPWEKMYAKAVSHLAPLGTLFIADYYPTPVPSQELIDRGNEAGLTSQLVNPRNDFSKYFELLKQHFSVDINRSDVNRSDAYFLIQTKK